uniref:Pyrrolo-quinoline quinone n=1 Tax=Solibacter usitatus (strain Ellin6076) TaxID=234267 RepID=Q01UL0_SOLUE
MKLSIILVLFALALTISLYPQGPADQWTIAGQDLADSRSQPSETKIGVSNVGNLAVKWKFTTESDVSATPTIDGDAVYFPDWAGNLFALKKTDGSILWSHKVADYDGFTGAISRVSPAIHGNDIIIGDLQSSTQPHNGAWIIAVDRQTGLLHWKTQVDSHLAAIITGPPVIAGNAVYAGVSSSEESLATNAAYPCCSFRGSMVALNANNGEILWQTFTVPDNHGRTDGYSGNAIWQPPAIDLARGLLYTGTGNNYEVPDEVKACLATATMAEQPSCFSSQDYFDSAMALDLRTGQVRWSRRLQGIDVWTVACVRNPTPVSCPIPASPDFDLSGSGPNLLPNIVGFGQKSGIYWALNPDTGAMVWSTVVGPGATLGGIEWGTATDGKRIYVAITNSAHLPYPLLDGRSITWGAWSALDVATGKILWQTADPFEAIDMGAVSVANGVVYAPSMSGNMHALDAATGKVLFTFASGGSVLDGPAIADGVVYWGSGYKKTGGGTTNNKIFAFGLPNMP